MTISADTDTQRIVLIDISNSDEASHDTSLEVEIKREPGRLTLTLISGGVPSSAHLLLENFNGRPIIFVWAGGGANVVRDPVCGSTVELSGLHCPPYSHRIEMKLPTQPPTEEQHNRPEQELALTAE